MQMAASVPRRTAPVPKNDVGRPRPLAGAPGFARDVHGRGHGLGPTKPSKPPRCAKGGHGLERRLSGQDDAGPNGAQGLVIGCPIARKAGREADWQDDHPAVAASAPTNSRAPGFCGDRASWISLLQPVWKTRRLRPVANRHQRLMKTDPRHRVRIGRCRPGILRTCRHLGRRGGISARIELARTGEKGGRWRDRSCCGFGRRRRKAACFFQTGCRARNP